MCLPLLSSGFVSTDHIFPGLASSWRTSRTFHKLFNKLSNTSTNISSARYLYPPTQTLDKSAQTVATGGCVKFLPTMSFISTETTRFMVYLNTYIYSYIYLNMCKYEILNFLLDCHLRTCRSFLQQLQCNGLLMKNTIREKGNTTL